jgi:hypothetical protein
VSEINTYNSGGEGPTDRTALQELLAALSATGRALRRDGCKAWRINGTRGHIYTWGTPGRWVLTVSCRTARHWTATKRRLVFCRVTQDGDDEGCLRLDAPPTTDEAAAIRKALGIRKRRAFDEDTLDRMRVNAKSRFRRKRPDDGASPLLG